MSSQRRRLLAELAAELPDYAGSAVRLNIAIAHQVGMPLTDVQCMGLLAAKPAAPGWLAERLGLTTGAVTKVLDRLERAGYVTRSADPGDRRRVLITAVPTALEELGGLFAAVGERMSRDLEGYDEGGLEAILGFVRAGQQAAEEEIDRIRSTGLSHAVRGRRGAAGASES